MQHGHIYQSHHAWFLRYRLNGKQTAKRLAPFSNEYRTIKSVRHLAEAILSPLNQGAAPSSQQTIQDFVERIYLPYAAGHKRPSTHRGYANLYNGQIAARVAGVKIATFRTVDAQRLLDRIAAETTISHRTHIHIKALLSGIFAYAKRQGVIDANPIMGTEIPKGHAGTQTHAYTMDEITQLLSKLEGVARTAVVVAAWTGLSLAELRGLKWEDIEDEQITVKRTWWHQYESGPKTQARGAAVPLLPDVRAELMAHKARTLGTKFVFEGPKQTPLDLATLGSKTIKTALKRSGVEWYGWHALRRGLATNLHEAGVQDKIIQGILRHSSLAVTMSHYVKPLPAASVEAMRRLDASRK